MGDALPIVAGGGLAVRAIAHADERFASCCFSADTPVATVGGATAIGDLQVGDHVLAYDEATGTTGSYTVTAVLVHTVLRLNSVDNSDLPRPARYLLNFTRIR